MFGIDFFMIKEYIIDFLGLKKKNVIIEKDLLSYENDVIDFSFIGDGFVLNDNKDILITKEYFNISGIIGKRSTRSFYGKKTRFINVFKKYRKGWILHQIIPISEYVITNFENISLSPSGNELVIISSETYNNEFYFHISYYKLQDGFYVDVKKDVIKANYNKYMRLKTSQIYVNFITLKLSIYVRDYDTNTSHVLEIDLENEIKLLSNTPLSLICDTEDKCLSNSRTTMSRYSYLRSINIFPKNNVDMITLNFYDTVDKKILSFKVDPKTTKLKNNSYIKDIQLFLYEGYVFITYEDFRDDCFSIFEINENWDKLNLLQEFVLDEEVKKLSKNNKVDFFIKWCSRSDIDVKTSSDFKYIQISYLTDFTLFFNFHCNRLILTRNEDGVYEPTGIYLQDSNDELVIKNKKDKMLEMLRLNLRKTSFYFNELSTNNLIEFHKERNKAVIKPTTNLDKQIITYGKQTVECENKYIIINHK